MKPIDKSGKRSGQRDKDRTCDPHDVNVVDHTPSRQKSAAQAPKTSRSCRNSNNKVGRKLGSWSDGLEIRWRGPNRDQPSYVIKPSLRLLRAKEQAFEASLDGRLTAVVEAKNICFILDPLRGKIRMPTVAADTAIIENLVVIYAISQILKLDRDQWNQFCLSEHWLNHRKRPRTNSDDSDHALLFVLRYAVADKNASSLTKSLNGLLQPFWSDGVKAQRLSGLVIKKLEKKRPSRPLSWKISDQPAANELQSITDRTSVTVTAIIHKDSKGRTVFEVQEVIAREVLEPPLL